MKSNYWFILIILFISIVTGCTNSIETTGVEDNIAADLNNKLKQNIGIQPLDFQPWNSDIEWVENHWKEIQHKMDDLLLSLELKGEIEPYIPKKYVTVRYENIIITIEDTKRPEEKIIVEKDNKSYLYYGENQKVIAVLGLLNFND